MASRISGRAVSMEPPGAAVSRVGRSMGSVGAHRPGGGPGLDQFAEFLLRPGRGHPVSARAPGPAYQDVFRHMVDDAGHVASAVALRVLDLLADLTQRLALPGHGGGREGPLGVSRRTRAGEILALVAAVATQASGHAFLIRAAQHDRLVRGHAIRLRRARRRRVAVEAAGRGEHLACLPEQPHRARREIRDPVEIGDRAKGSKTVGGRGRGGENAAAEQHRRTDAAEGHKRPNEHRERAVTTLDGREAQRSHVNVTPFLAKGCAR